MTVNRAPSCRQLKPDARLVPLQDRRPPARQPECRGGSFNDFSRHVYEDLQLVQFREKLLIPEVSLGWGEEIGVFPQNTFPRRTFATVSLTIKM